MPTVKVCLWNVQNYGAGDPAFKWGANSDLRNRFIAVFAEQHAIDILMIQEVSSRAEDSLDDLVVRMNSTMPAGHWAGSFVASALIKHARKPLQSSADVTFGTDARYEGYAVVWRTRERRFRLADAIHRIAQQTIYMRVDGPRTSPLNLSTLGRPAGYGWGLMWGATGGFTMDHPYPYDSTGRLMDEWPDLELPSTSIRNPNRIKLWRTRRPAYVIVELLDGPREDGRKFVPVGVYHAPSSAEGSELGTILSALARENYVSNTVLANGRVDTTELVSVSKAVMGGDFNYEARVWPWFYGNYVTPHDRGPDGGAWYAGAPVPPLSDVQRSTVVQLSDDRGVPIRGRTVDDFLTSMIDLAFFSASGSGARANVPAELLTRGAAYRPVLVALATHLRAEIDRLRGPRYNVTRTGPEHEHEDPRTGADVWSPMISGSYGATFVDWLEFLRQTAAGSVTDARRACELYRLFISDHLPLVVDINYTRA